MSLSSGFFNSVDHDRLYNAEDMSRLFDGLIRDGVFASIGTCMVVKANTQMTVNVGIGRAWFNHTWTLNDSILPVTLEQSHVLWPRIDAVVLEVNSEESVRLNSIKVVQGEPSTNPTKPTLTKSVLVNQYPLAYITVPAAATEIRQADIENAVGTTECPFVSGILSVISIEELIPQWKDILNRFVEENTANFNAWMNDEKVAYAQWLQSNKDDYDKLVKDQTTSYETWFDGIKNSYTNWFASIEEAYNVNWAAFQKWESDSKNDYNSWFAGVKSTYDTNWRDFQDWEAKTKDDFDAWYETIQNQLSGDVAAMIFDQLDQVNSKMISLIDSSEEMVEGTVEAPIVLANATRNLLKPTLATTTEKGVTFTNNGDGTYTLNGTAEDNIDVMISVSFYIEKGKKYIVAIAASNPNAGVNMYLINGTNNGFEVTSNDARELDYIGDTMSNKAVHITVNKATVLTNFVIKPMITENLDATYDDFVPYDGYDIVSAGPKLLTGSVRKYAYAAYKDGTYDASTQTVTFGAEDGSGAYLSLNNYIYLKSGSQYTLSVDLEASAAITDATIGVEGKNFNKYITSLPAGKSTQSFDFTYDGNAKLSFVCYGNAANSGKTVKISNLKILRKGVTEANYGLYEETNSVHITPETKFPLYSLTSYEGNNTIISPTNFEAYTVDQYNGKALLESAKLGVEAKRDKVGLIKSEDKHIPETIKAPLMVTDAGRNLLNPTLTTVTQNGVTCTNNGDGTYTFNGTATAYTQFVIGDDSNVGVGETCKVLGLPEDANANTFYMTWMYYSTIPSKSGYIGTKKSSNGTREITFAVCSGVTLTNFVIKPMLTTDLTATYDNFVPYSGYDVKTCGKNLLDMVGKGNARYTNAGVTANRISDGSYILTGTGTTSPLNLWLSGGYQKDPLLGAPILLTLKVGHTYAIHDCTLFGYSNDVYTHFDDVIAVANYDKIITGVREKTGIVVAGSITIKPAVYDITGYIKERPEDWAFVPYVEGPTIHIDSSTQFPIMGLETMDGETNVISPASIETYHTDDENGRVLLEMIYKAANSGGIHYSADAPTGAKTGDFWIKPSSGELMYYDGSNWVLPKAGDVIGSDVVKSNTKPMHGRDVLWIDSANGNVMKHVDAAGTVTELAAGGVSVGATAPTNTKLLWIDTSSGGVSKYYNGSAWVATASVWG